MANGIAALLMCLACIGALFGLAAVVLAGRYRAVPLADAKLPSITVLKPLHGAEPALEANLNSVFAQDYPAPIQIIAGVSDPDDPARACFAAVAARHPNIVSHIIVDALQHGLNNKLSNLTNMAPAIEHGLVVIADSDVAWMPDTLRRLASAMGDPTVGLATCLHVGRGDVGFWSRMAAMDISYRYMPMVIVGTAMGLARPALGPTMAMSRDALESIGGFARFATVLADDYEIGRAIREQGLQTILPPLFVTHGCAESSLGALLAHELRWSLTIARIDFAGFIGSITLHALPLALLGMVLANFPIESWIVLGTVLAARWATKARIDAVAGRSSGPAWLLPIRDLLSFGVFCATFVIKKVDWRGAQFRVTRDGKLHSLQGSAP